MCRETQKVEDLQRRNGNLLQQIDSLQNDHKRALEELEMKRQQHQLFNTNLARCEGIGTLQTLYRILLVPPEASAELITDHFRKLSVQSVYA